METDAGQTIRGLIDAALRGDGFDAASGGLMAIMGQSRPTIQQDIPAAFEMYALLAHYQTILPVQAARLGERYPDIPLHPAIRYDAAWRRLVAVLPIAAGELEHVAYWLAERLPSARVKTFAGRLALPFSIESRDGVDQLLPEWFAVFYVQGAADAGLPILALRSVLDDPRFGDWMEVALQRMALFRLPRRRLRTRRVADPAAPRGVI